MKYFSYLIVLLFFITSCSSGKMSLSIPANQSIELDLPQYEVYSASLKNKSLKEVSVAVLSKENEKQVRGFGLGTKGKAEVMVEQNSKLRLKNNSNSSLKITVDIEPKDMSVFNRTGDYIKFTLQNTTAKSIPLLIPSVMNPNLSPFSKSGVDLKVGQEILFRANGKRYVLFTVDNSIAQGSMIDVAKLIKNRKKELGL